MPDPGGSPSQELTAGRDPGARLHGEAETSGNSIEITRPRRPPERLTEPRIDAGDPAPERAPGGLGLVDDRDQLEIRCAKRHDPICGAPTGVAATNNGCEAVPRLDLRGGRIEIGDRDQYVVELQTTEPRCET